MTETTNGQPTLDLGGKPSAGEVLKRIRAESRDEAEKGRWFEQLFMRVALQLPEYEISEIWRWPDWPDREELTGLVGTDIGIDLVAKRHTGDYAAIQCKCYKEGHKVAKGEIDKFLAATLNPIYSVRWIVSTSGLGRNAKAAIHRAVPNVTHKDFRIHHDVIVEEEDAERIVQEPWPLQAEAIERVVTGLGNHDRGRLIMACGTGKTFTALRIAERIVHEGGRILFAAPSIALVSQARHEWLRQTTRELGSLVVCSDTTAGGRGGYEDIGVSELECPVSTDPELIAKRLKGNGLTRVVFCTYQSLRQVTDAQSIHGAPAFDLAIADEAHRTTGAIRESREVDFQEFHDGNRLHANKRLYMTATPRTYTLSSKRKASKQGIEVIDMNDQEKYGPQLYLLPFSKAVEHDLLSDYRVIVLGVNVSSVTPALRRRLEAISTSENKVRNQSQTPTTSDMTKVLGVSLAINGVTKGLAEETPRKLSRTIAFSNSIERSKWFAQALMLSEVRSTTTRNIRSDQNRTDQAQKVDARHLDASNSALQRSQALKALEKAEQEGECRVLCNVRLFTEGVDVPQLDSVAFLDPRSSQVDVVQAVGRVMRKALGKRYGYIIVPVVIGPEQDVIDALIQGTEGYTTIGRVLRALQAHDGRLAHSLEEFISVLVPNGNGGIVLPPRPRPNGGGYGTGGGGNGGGSGVEPIFEEIYARVASASGLGKPGQFVADEIEDVVKHTSEVFQREKLESTLANVLDLVPEVDGGAKGVCTIASLMLCNACLLQRRLRDEPGMESIEGLDKAATEPSPKKVLAVAWKTILAKDYAPVFRPALAVISCLPDIDVVDEAVLLIAECANRIADSLSEMGYDHAGPLYHRILGSAKSDGAFYTNNLSAVMLSRLAFPRDWIDWSEKKEVSKLRVMDPACGTGTLLMATLQTIKDRVSEGGGGELPSEERNALHKILVEDVLCGLDINQHGVQLAACNLTLGAPTVDYKRMNLVAMPHGPQSEGPCKAGSLELLAAADNPQDLRSIIEPIRSFDSIDASQVDESAEIRFPLRELDAIIMNAPFTANENRNRKYGDEGRKAMQQRELEIKEIFERSNASGIGTITSNSIQTFFSPLADMLLHENRGILAMVVPTTVCTGTASLLQRKFLAERFHIETVVTSHDPKRPNFSENTSIHESLLICRRRSMDASAGDYQTRFISLRKMPATRKETFEAVDAIQDGEQGHWYTEFKQPEQLVKIGDWRPCQFSDPTLVGAVFQLEQHQSLSQLANRYTLGPAGQAIRVSFTTVEYRTNYPMFWGRSMKLRISMQSKPDKFGKPKRLSTSDAYMEKAGNLLLAAKFDAISGRLLAIYSEEKSLGSMWVPVSAFSISKDEAQALCAWFNSTLGALGFFFRRGTKLTNPGFSQEVLRELPVPDFTLVDATALVEAYQSTKDLTVKPWKEAANDNMRDVLDQAAATTLGIPIEKIRKLRESISREPTISNVRAEVKS